MNEIDEEMQQIMLNYLRKAYPIKRLKDGRRFKRGIVSDTGDKLYLTPQSDAERTFKNLDTNLKRVFSAEQLEINILLLKYLGLL